MPDLFKEAVRHHYAGTMRKFEALVTKKGEAEDLTQEVYVRLLKSDIETTPIQDLGAYIRGIERHVFCEFVENKKRATVYRLTEGGNREPSGGEEGLRAMEKKELAGKLHQFLGELPPRDREIVVGSIMFGSSTAELGQSLGIPRQTVRSRLSRAIDELRRKARVAGLMA